MMFDRVTAPGRIDLTTGFGDRVAMEMLAGPALRSADCHAPPVSIVVIQLADAQDVGVRDRAISLALRASVRATDQLFRIDEDTVVAVLSVTTDAGAKKVMSRVARLTDRPFAYGVATSPRDGRNLELLVEQARARATLDRRWF